MNSLTSDETVLGSGEFGVVRSGVLNGQAVAVKKLKPTVGVDEFKVVLAEMKIMSYLGDHENVVKFFGSDVSHIAHCKCDSAGDEETWPLVVSLCVMLLIPGQITIVTELSPHGDLLHYLWNVGSEGLKMPQKM